MHKIIENGTTVLIADDGMMLTDDSAFGTAVRLGKGDDESRWYEITEAEVNERMKTIEYEDYSVWKEVAEDDLSKEENE